MENLTTNETILLYPKQSVFNLPPSDVETDRLLNRIKFKVEEILQSNEFRQSGLNTSRAEYSTLQSLRNKPLIYLPSDKGSEFCVLEETRHKERGFEHLNDVSTYRPITHYCKNCRNKGKCYLE
jgi:hypothetical protein